MNNITYHLNHDLISNKIKEEFSKRWECLDLPSFEEFFNSIDNEMNLWYSSAKHIKESYTDYVKGTLEGRFPPNLKYYPREVFKQVVVEAEKMINF